MDGIRHLPTTPDALDGWHLDGRGLSIDVDVVAHGVSVRMVGELDAGSSADVDRVLSMAQELGSPLLLDLDGVSFMDSAGIRVLVHSAEALQAAGSGLRVVRASPVVDRILRVTGIYEPLRKPCR